MREFVAQYVAVVALTGHVPEAEQAATRPAQTEAAGAGEVGESRGRGQRPRLQTTREPAPPSSPADRIALRRLQVEVVHGAHLIFRVRRRLGVHELHLDLRGLGLIAIVPPLEGLRFGSAPSGTVAISLPSR